MPTKAKLIMYLNNSRFVDIDIEIPDYFELQGEEDATWAEKNQLRIDARKEYVDKMIVRFCLTHVRALQKVNFNYQISLNILK